MDWGALVEPAIILVLILLNGFFAGAEIAVLTAKRGRLQQLAEQGDRGAKTALALGADADNFLPTVQVGITLVGTFAAAFGGASFVEDISALLEKVPVAFVAERRQGIALALVSLGIAFFSLILGELVPKRVALQNAEFMSRWVAIPMYVLQRVTQPIVWFLRLCTSVLLRCLGQSTEMSSTVSVEDIQHMLDAGGEAGILKGSEQRVATEALKLRERTIAEIMQPRIEIDAIDIDTPSEEVIGAIAMSGFSRIPVCEGSIDHITGFVYIKDVFLQHYLGRPIDLRRMIRPPLFIPRTLGISRLLELFQENRTQLAIVLDEYGGTEGMVTLENILEVLVGDIHDEHRRDHEQDFVTRDDGSLLVDAGVSLHQLEEHLEISRWNVPPPKGIGTLSGLVLSLLKRPPQISDTMSWNGLRIEIMDMDGPRIDRLLIQREGEAPPAEPAEAARPG